MKRILFILILIFSTALFAQDDGFIEFEFNGDSLTIWHYGAWRNCGAIYQMDLIMVDSTIYLMENDTSSMWEWCMCYFDLATSITMPEPGRYNLIIHTTNKNNGDTSLVADTSFTVNQIQVISFSDPECVNILSKAATVSGTEIPVINSSVSECQIDAYNDIYYWSNEGELTITWYTDSINCNIIPQWQAMMSNDTIRVTMTDTNPGDECVCPKYFTMTIGPIPNGKYVLNFLEGMYLFSTVIINQQLNLETAGSDLIMYWDVEELNCCLETLWESWLDGNVFHVVMTDTGAPCDCLCPFELSVRFGPFPPGNYTLDFENTYLAGPFEFTIQSLRKPSATATILSYYQSECYDAVKTEDHQQIAQKYALMRSYPNPFNPTATIEFYLPERTEVLIEIYDITGSCVQEIYSGVLASGGYSRPWNATGFPSGIYFIHLSGQNIHLTNKVLLLK